MTLRLSALTLTTLLLAGCGGSYGGSATTPTQTPTTGGGAVGATIMIRAGGRLEPREVRIQRGERVSFVNQDSRMREPTSNPHPLHTDCPALNVGAVSPGQTRDSTALNDIRVCGFHDHSDPDNEDMWGTVRIGDAQGDPGPVYIRP